VPPSSQSSEVQTLSEATKNLVDALQFECTINLSTDAVLITTVDDTHAAIPPLRLSEEQFEALSKPSPG
jgi:hypothetical protein